MKTTIVLLAIVLLIAIPIPIQAQGYEVTPPAQAAGDGYGLGCPGCPGCPDNPVRNPNEPACY